VWRDVEVQQPTMAFAASALVRLRRAPPATDRTTESNEDVVELMMTVGAIPDRQRRSDEFLLAAQDVLRQGIRLGVQSRIDHDAGIQSREGSKIYLLVRS
jgi:hypothetical protein